MRRPLLSLLVILLWAFVASAQNDYTSTPNLGLKKPKIGSTNGGIYINQDFDTLDAAIGVFHGGFVAVPFSATPVFDMTKGNTFAITLSGNVTSSSVNQPGITSGQIQYLIVCQDSTGNRTFTFPSTYQNASSITVSPAASTCTASTWLWDGQISQWINVNGLGTSGGKTLIPFTTVAFSATPAFLGTSSAAYGITLTGNVTSSTVSGSPVNGVLMKLHICQGAGGPWTFAFPASFLNTTAIQSTGCTDETYSYDGVANWSQLTQPPGSGGGGSCSSSGSQGTLLATGGSPGACQTTNVSETNSTLVVNEDFQPAGANPYVDMRKYARQISKVSTAVLGTVNATCTSGQPTITLSAASDFQNGDGVTLIHCGALNSSTAVAAPTVTAAGAAGGTGTRIVKSSTGATVGSTTRSYCAVGVTRGRGTSACSSTTTITNAAASLGTQSVTNSTLAVSGTTVTVTTSSPHTLSVGYEINVAGTLDANGNPADATFGGNYSVASVPDTTHYTYFIRQSTLNGAIASGTSGTTTWNNLVHLVKTAEGTYDFYVMYDTAANRVACITEPVNSNLIGDQTYLACDDNGTTINGNFLVPAYLSATVPASATNDSLTTTISSGAGSTSLTLAANAGNSTTSPIYFDNAPNYIIAANAANALGAPLYLSVTSGNNIWFNNSYVTWPAGTKILQAGIVQSYDTWNISNLNFWHGVPGAPCIKPSFALVCAPIFFVGPAYPGAYGTGATDLDLLTFDSGLTNDPSPLLLLDAPGDFHPSRLNFTGSGSASEYLMMGLELRGHHGNGVQPFVMTLSDLGFTGGPAQVNSSTSTPLFYCNTCGSHVINGLSVGRRGALWRLADSGTQATIHFVYNQGGINPLFRTVGADSGVANATLNIDNCTQDTTAMPIVSALLNASTRVIATNCNSPSAKSPGGVPPFATGNIAYANQISAGGAIAPIGANTNNCASLTTWDQVFNPVFSTTTEGICGISTQTVISPGYALAATDVNNIAPTCAVSAGPPLTPAGTYTFNSAAQWFNGPGSLSPASASCTSNGSQLITVTMPTLPPVGSSGWDVFWQGGPAGTSFPSTTTSTYQFTLANSGGLPTLGIGGGAGIQNSATTPHAVWGNFYPNAPNNSPVGAPTVIDSTGKIISTPQSVDATTKSGVDMCAKINAAWVELGLTPFAGGGGTNDARGFHGPQACAGSMFASYPANFTGKLILSPDVQINSDVSQVMPQGGVIIDGNSGHPTSTPFNGVGATIRASNAFIAANGPVIQMGSGAASFGNKLWNLRVSCVQPNNSTVQAGCIPVQNQWTQEGAEIYNVWLDGGSDTDLDISTSQAQNSTYENLSFGMSNVNNANATCMRVGSAATSALRAAIEIKHFTCNGSGNAAAQLVGVAVDASSVTLSDYHAEQVVTAIEVASQRSTHAVTILNGNCTSTAGKPMTTCIDLSSSNPSDAFTIIGNQTPSGTNVTNALVDHEPSGQTVTAAGEGGVGFYTRGQNNSIITTSGIGGTAGNFNTVLQTFSTSQTLNPTFYWANFTASVTATVPHAQAGQRWVVFCVSPCATLTIAPDTGNITLNNATGATASITTGLGVQVSCDGTNCFAWGLGGTGGGGSGTVGSGAVNGPAYYTAATTTGSVTPPTSPNGVPSTLTSTPSGGLSQPPALSLPGITGRAVSGITSTDTILSTDCNPNRVEYVGSVAVAVTLPTAVTLGVPKCVFKIVNQTSPAQTVTITPTTWTTSGGLAACPNNGSSCAINFGQQAWFYVDPNSATNWMVDITDLAGNVSGGAVPVSATVAGTDSNSRVIAAALANTKVWIGSAGNLPVAQTISQDASLANTGALTVTGANGGQFPASASVLGTDSGKRPITATGHATALPWECTDTSGSGSAQVCNTSPSFTPVAGDTIIYTTTTSNSGAALTINVNSLGAKPVAKWQTSTTLVANDIRANTEVLMTYDGTNWEATTIGNAPAGGSAVPCNLTNNSVQYDNSNAFGCMAEFTYASSTLTVGNPGKIDMSGASVTAALLVPKAAGASPTNGGIVSYDTTCNCLKYGNAVNTSTPTWITAAQTSAGIAGWSGTTGQLTTITALPNGTTAATQSTNDGSTKVATTNYVDTGIANAIAAVNPAMAVQAATVGSTDLSGYTYSNGVSGIGATLTAGSNNVALTVDGFTFTVIGQRLLVKNQSSAFQNGIYNVTQLQGVALPVILTRALDYDQPSDINNTGAIPVVNGTVNADTSWLLTSTVNTVGTDALTYVQFSIAPTSIVTATANLTSNIPAIGAGSKTLSAGYTFTPGSVTSGHLACYTSSGTVGNCTGLAGIIGVFTSSTTFTAGGETSVTLDATVNVTFGDNLCVSSTSFGTAHDNGATACTTGLGIGIVKTTASSVSSATAFVALR